MVDPTSTATAQTEIILRSIEVTEIRLRANVAAILRNSEGKILVCERLREKGAWQFPQGGVDDGEELEAAMLRELREEIGVKKGDLHIVEKRGPYQYVFGDGRTKKGFHGKEQHYFLCDYTGPDSRIDVKTKDPEFRDWKWIGAGEFQISWLPEMKREVYRAVLWDFLQVKI